MFERFVAWLKDWYEILGDPNNWDDGDDPCPYKCDCKQGKK